MLLPNLLRGLEVDDVELAVDAADAIDRARVAVASEKTVVSVAMTSGFASLRQSMKDLTQSSSS